MSGDKIEYRVPKGILKPSLSIAGHNLSSAFLKIVPGVKPLFPVSAFISLLVSLLCPASPCRAGGKGNSSGVMSYIDRSTRTGHAGRYSVAGKRTLSDEQGNRAGDDYHGGPSENDWG
jgi:hypothetical protein